jgi:plasmid stabilization system protein ParE
MRKKESALVVPKSIILLPQAESDIQSAYQWYEKCESGLGEVLLAAVDAALAAIAKQPDIYPLIVDSLRRNRVQRFPHSVFYTQDDHTVYVVAVFHSSRHPNRLISRLKNL